MLPPKPSSCRRAPMPAWQAAARLVLMTASASAVALLASCSTPPPPPTVDDSVRRPVNAPGAVEQHACRADLSAARAALHEATHQAAQATAMAQNAIAQTVRARPLPDSRCEARTGSTNTVFVVPFALGSAQWRLDPAASERVLDAVRTADLVLVRGRTDGAVDAPGELSLARRRAEAAAIWLRAQGVGGERLRLQWQAGSIDSDGADPYTLRRVEIEVYSKGPRVIALGATTAPSPPARGTADKAFTGN